MTTIRLRVAHWCDLCEAEFRIREALARDIGNSVDSLMMGENRQPQKKGDLLEPPALITPEEVR